MDSYYGNDQDKQYRSHKHSAIPADESRAGDYAFPVFLDIDDPIDQIYHIPVQGTDPGDQPWITTCKKPAEREYAQGSNDRDVKSANACESR